MVSRLAPRPIAPSQCRSFSSGLEEIKEPPGPDHVSSQSLGTSPQLAVRGHERNRLISGIRDDVDKHVVTAALGVQDGDTIRETILSALTSLAFQHHDDGLGDPSGANGSLHSAHERSGSSRSVPPPARRTRSDDVGCINEKH
jgi:hypothetical protein